ncbi:hypothetical protein [Ornithinibacillus halophilus]|uniref:Uncharacterized protein n=1 Tax=Ornithinibacillus halophilus TaxID=930117 RepID=A0A1M5NH43_9BACI|nr:hypothetical protein [Ornithinibacillus halophilus]SHG88884.1 hypothetical protein SAMN05216225_10802 [Ornithinibacillus halophilus]
MFNERRFSFEEPRESQKGGPKIEIRSFVKIFSRPDEHKEVLEMIQIGAEFNMPNRAIMEFYGRDLIAYKRRYKSNEQVNHFLHILSHYMKEYYDKDCPKSWKECQPSFWEELLITYLPTIIKISVNQIETRQFLFQLKKFVRWLDKTTGSSWYEKVSADIEEYKMELIACEATLNDVFQSMYPKIHDSDWDPRKDIHTIINRMEECTDTFHSLFEVLEINGEVITVCDNELKLPFHILGFPTAHLQIGMMLCGMIGKESGDNYWTWYITDGIYPHKAGEFIQMVNTY